MQYHYIKKMIELKIINISYVFFSKRDEYSYQIIGQNKIQQRFETIEIYGIKIEMWNENVENFHVYNSQNLSLCHAID